MPVLWAPEPLLEAKMSPLGSVARCGGLPRRGRLPRVAVGRRPLAALLVDGLVDLRLQVPHNEVLIGRR
eukprot:5138547-Pyramimonas_sp.AAC.1